MRGLLSVSLMILTACGDGSSGGGEGTSSTAPTTYSSGSTTQSGSAGGTTQSVASLAGTYSWKVGTVTMSCDDGSRTLLDPFAKNLDITISGNTIKLGASAGDTTNTDASAGGMTMTLSGYSGLIEKDGSFSAKQTGRGRHVTYGGIGLSYTLNGKILASGTWTGDYKYSLNFEDYFVLCNYTAKFAGEKQ